MHHHTYNECTCRGPKGTERVFEDIMADNFQMY